jgi:hypothetical protein
LYDLENEKDASSETPQEVTVHVSRRRELMDAVTQHESCPFGLSTRTNGSPPTNETSRLRQDPRTTKPQPRAPYVDEMVNFDARCSFCDRMGHIVNNCRKRLKQCFICGSPNHFVSRCPRRDRDNAASVRRRPSLQPPCVRGTQDHATRDLRQSSSSSRLQALN